LIGVPAGKKPVATLISTVGEEPEKARVNVAGAVLVTVT